MMCKFKRWIEKGGHYDVELKRWMQRGYYDVQIKREDGYGRVKWHFKERIDGKKGNVMCKLRGWVDKGGHYDVQM